MDPQRLNDLAERFALIIEGLCKAISAPQGRFGGWLLFFIPNRFRLIGQDLAELAALLRSGKLFVHAPSRSCTASREASSTPSSSGLASAGPARSRASGALWLADQGEPRDGGVIWRLSDVPVAGPQDAGADPAPHGAALTPALPDAARLEHETHPAPDKARRPAPSERDGADRAPSSRSHPAFGRVFHPYGGSGSGDHAPMADQAAAPLDAALRRLRGRPPDPASFANRAPVRLSTP